jgi:hypothetical protein
MADLPSGTTEAFAQAMQVVKQTDQYVEDRITDILSKSDDLFTAAEATLSALKDFKLDLPTTSVPQAPDLGTAPKISFDLPEINSTSFGTISAGSVSKPNLDPMPNPASVAIPEFNGTVPVINIPAAPTWTAPDAPPDRPDTGTVDIPVAPDYTIPDAPTLADISIPDFTGLQLPTFDAVAPDFEGTSLPAALQWSEPVYKTEILEEMMDKLRDMWSGRTGLPIAVEQAMYERAAERDDLTAQREIDSVATDFSGRGFTAPSGVMAARIGDLREDLALKKFGTNREITIQFAQVHVENLRFACQQAVAAENVLVNIFENSANRMFEAAKFQVESAINIYNAQVTVFNAKMQAFDVKARVFSTLVSAELAKVEVYKAEVQAEVARGQINQQKVEAYSAQISALNALIGIFRTKMEGAQVQADVIKTAIDAYSSDVQAYAQRIAADKTRFDAYNSLIQGENTKAQVYDSEARAYASLVSGKATVADMNIKIADFAIEKNKTLLQQYLADIDMQKASISAQLASIQANSQAYIADTQRYSAEASAESAYANVQATTYEAQARINVAYYSAQVQAYISNLEQMIEKAKLALQAMTSAGSISSTLAAGAMAGMHVAASISGTGNATASGSYANTASDSTSKSTTTNYNYSN